MKIIILFFSLFLFFSSCVKRISDPSWVEISEWELLANSNLGSLEGALSHNFSDAWVYADGQLVGVFELPVKFPMLKEGTTVFTILPTILNNGIAATKKAYPFVQPYEVTVTLIKNKTIIINPVTKHNDNVKFWIEDFEESTIKFEPDLGTSLASLVQANDPSILKYGNYYGHIALNSIDSIYAGYSLETQGLVLPNKGAEVYLEIDYHSTNTLITGLIEHSPTTVQYHPNIQINGQDESYVVWKKIYIDLKEIVSGTSSSEYYKVSFIAQLNAGGVTRDIIIDNIKVLYR